MMETGNKTKILLPAAYLPPVEYFVFLIHFPALVEAWETYPKQTYRNRCYILTEKGKTALSIPVRKPFGNHSKTGEVLINYDIRWQRQHWRAITSAYSSSAFFLYYKDNLEPFFHSEEKKLLEFNLKLTEALAEIIGITVNISVTEKFEKEPPGILDLRYDLSPKKPPLLQEFPAYFQVFSDRHPFIPDLSILDLLFNLGPETKDYLLSLPVLQFGRLVL